MNRRGFISLLAGSAGAALIGWRIPKPVIVLPARQVWTPILDAAPHHSLCNCSACVSGPYSPQEILHGMDRTFEYINSVPFVARRFERVGDGLVEETDAAFRERVLTAIASAPLAPAQARELDTYLRLARRGP